MPRRFVLRFLETFFRSFWLNILPLAVMLVGAIIFLRQPVYVSKASIYVQDDNLLQQLTQIRIREQSYNSFSGIGVVSPSQFAVNEFRELLRTDAFAYAVIAESDLRDQLNGSPSQVRSVLRFFRESMIVESEGSNLVRLRVEADQPVLAYQFAVSTLKAYRSWKVSNDVQESTIAQSFFEEIIGPYREDLDAARDSLRDYLEQYPEPPVGARPVEESLQIEKLQSEITLAEDRLNSLLNKAESARLALAQSERDVDQSYRLVDQPVVADMPEPIVNQLLLATLFPIVGLLLTLILVLGRLVIERTLLNRLDIREELFLPVLAEIHHQPSGPYANRSHQISTTKEVTDERVADSVRV